MKISYLASSALGLALWIQPIWALELETVLNQVARSNPVVQQSNALAEQAERQRQQAFGTYLPTLTATGEIANEEFEFGRTTGSAQPRSYGLTLKQTLFNGGNRYATYRSARHTATAAQAAAENQLQQQIIAAARAYGEVLAAQATVAAEEAQVLILRERLSETQIRAEEGAATNTDQAQARARLATAEAQLAQGQANLVAATERLSSLYGMLTTADLAQLSWPASHTMALNKEFTLPLTDHGVQAALSRHPQVEQALVEFAAARYGVAGARSTYFPTLTASASWQKNEGSNFGGSTADSETERVALNASWELFNGFQSQRGAQAAIAGREAAQQAYAQAQRDVQAELLASASSFKGAQLQVRGFEAALSAAELANTGVQREFELGRRPFLDVLDATQEVRDAKVNLATARAGHITAYYRLKAAFGVLHQDFIAE